MKFHIHIEEGYDDGSKAKPDEAEKNARNSQPSCCRISTIHHDDIQNTYNIKHKFFLHQITILIKKIK